MTKQRLIFKIIHTSQTFTVYVHEHALLSYCPVRYHYQKKWISNNTHKCVLTHIFYLDIGQSMGPEMSGPLGFREFVAEKLSSMVGKSVLVLEGR